MYLVNAALLTLQAVSQPFRFFMKQNRYFDIFLIVHSTRNQYIEPKLGNLFTVTPPQDQKNIL